MLRVLFLMLCCYAVLGATPARAEEGRDAILILDASGSMWGQIGGVSKIVIAKDVVEGLLRRLPEEQRLGLVAYGHRRKGDCRDIETLAEMSASRKDAIDALRSVTPHGKTPLTASVQHAAEALDYTKNAATVILVSDGMETCEADPCALARTLEENGLDFTVHVVGFDVTMEERKSLQCLAGATGGLFLAADSAAELDAALSQMTLGAPEPAASPKPARVTLKATLLPGGPLLQRNLAWIVAPAAGGAPVFLREGTGIVEAELVPGAYVVEVAWSGWKDGKVKQGRAELTVRPQSAQVFTVPVNLALPVTLEAPEEALEGALVPVTWQGPDDLGAIIAVAEPEDAPRDHAYFFATGPARLRAAVGPDASARAELQMPGAPGPYEIRYILNDPKLVLARKPILVRARSYALVAPEEAPIASEIEVGWDGPGLAGDAITIARAGAAEALDRLHYVTLDKANPVRLAMPAEPGEYEVRYVLGVDGLAKASLPIRATAVAALLDAPASVEGGATIEVGWEGPEGWENDQISVTKRGEGFNRESFADLAKGGIRTNPVALRVPAIAGEYEVVYLVNPGRKAVTRMPLAITAPTASLKAPSAGKAGEPIEVAYVGSGHPGDRIVLVPADQPDHAMWGVTVNFGFAAMPRETTGTIPARLTGKPGEYEIRYVTGMQDLVITRTKITISE